MTPPQLYHKSEERTFFAHHMFLSIAQLNIEDAEATKVGQFYKCLTAMVMISLAIEALVNAVGFRVEDDWLWFEGLSPHKKIDQLVNRLHIQKSQSIELWETLRYLGGFRNDIAHPKPEKKIINHTLSKAGLTKTAFDKPLLTLEREITLAKAKRSYAAVHKLKGILTNAMPEKDRFGIYNDGWHGSTTEYKP